MKRMLRFAAAFGVVALGVALASSSLAASDAQGFGGSALRAVGRLTESGVLLVWGTALAGFSGAVGRRRSPKK